MKTRTANLQVAHQKGCAAGRAASLESLERCTCQPSYSTYYRDSAGRIVRGDRTRNRREADRMLDRLQHQLDEHREPQRPKSITLPAWVDEYKAGLEKRVGRGKLKARTLRDYTDTLDRAVNAIGHADLREIGSRELERFLESYEEEARKRRGELASISDATLARALRELRACLAEAVDEGYLDRNPVRPYLKKRELDVGGRGKDPFTDEELTKLWAALASRDNHGQPTEGGADPVYLHLFRVAVATGARLGELIALDWDDVSITERKLQIRHTYNVTDGLIPPKTKGSVRTIFLTPAATREFEALAAAGSAPALTGPVFVGPHGERINGSYASRALDRARKAASIPKLGESGLPRSFHSFRSTYDRRALEQGLHPEFVRAQLGHTGLELTLNHYGKWSDAAMLAEADKAATEL